MSPSQSSSIESKPRRKRILSLIGIAMGSLLTSVFLAPALLLLGVVAMGVAGYLAWTHQSQSKTVALMAAAVLVGVAPWWIIGIIGARGY